MLKLGASAPASDRVLFGALSWKSVAGLVLFGCGGLLYAFLLRWVPLNVAQSFAAAQFIGVIAAASPMLNQPHSPGGWDGPGPVWGGIPLGGVPARAQAGAPRPRSP